MMSRLLIVRIIAASWLLFSAGLLSAQIADLSKAEIVVSPAIRSPFRETAIKVLQEEIVQRAFLLLPLTQQVKNTSVIVPATINDSSECAHAISGRRCNRYEMVLGNKGRFGLLAEYGSLSFIVIRN